MVFFLSGGLLDDADENFVGNVTGKVTSVFGNFLNIVRIVGLGLAMIMLTWMAISYFTADGRGFPGAAEVQARIKGSQLTKFVIGLVIFFGAGSVVSWIAELLVEIVTN